MTTIIDYILDLFRSPDLAGAFVSDPEQALRDAGLPNVTAAQLSAVAATAAQLQAVAATAAPAGVALGGGDPVLGLQRAVADHHSIATSFAPMYAPQRTFAPETDVASHNRTNAEFLSPDQSSGANSQVGGFNLGFGDITFGNKSTTTDGVFHTNIQTNLVTKVETDADGNFAVSLEPGVYSLFTKEEKGLYANLFDGENNIYPVEVQEGQVSHIEFLINYEASY